MITTTYGNNTMARSDTKTALAVSHGIAVAHFEGTSQGAASMASAGVPIDVALRVLLRPHLRRPTDWR